MKNNSPDINRHGNYAKVDSNNSSQINSAFATNAITCNKTNPDGSVENVLEINAERAREENIENKK